MVPFGESVLPCISTTPAVCAKIGTARPMTVASVSSPVTNPLMPGLPSQIIPGSGRAARRCKRRKADGARSHSRPGGSREAHRARLALFVEIEGGFPDRDPAVAHDPDLNPAAGHLFAGDS